MSDIDPFRVYESGIILDRDHADMIWQHTLVPHDFLLGDLHRVIDEALDTQDERPETICLDPWDAIGLAHYYRKLGKVTLPFDLTVASKYFQWSKTLDETEASMAARLSSTGE